MKSRTRRSHPFAIFAISIFSTLALGASAQAANFTVTTTAGDASAGSLVNAIDLANANPSDRDTINFNIGGSATINLADSLPPLTGPVEIVGPGAEELTIDAGADQAHALFVTTKDLSVSGLSLINGQHEFGQAGNGGSISSTGGNLKVDSVQVFGSEARYGVGGGLYATGGTVEVEGSAFIGGHARDGGGVYIEGASQVSIMDTSISNNVGLNYFAGQNGPNYAGGLAVIDSPRVEIENATINNNRSTNGAGFWIVDAGEVTITNSRVSENLSSPAELPLPIGYKDYGTARVQADKTTVTSSRFTGNSSDLLAGLEIEGPATVSGSLFNENSSGAGGAGLNLTAAQGQTTVSSVNNSTITGNVTGNYGVGLLSQGDVKVDSTTISGNSIMVPVYKQLNGAGLFQWYGTATVTNSIISGNSPADISAVRTVPESINPDTDFGGYAQGSFNLIGKSVAGPFKELVAGSNIESNDPGLGELADNGGSLDSMMPEAGSPVIDAGKTALTTDQLGLPRPVAFGWLTKPSGGNRADIGAVEVQSLNGPANRFKIGKVKLNRKKGTATVKVKVPWSGKVQLRGSKTVKASSRSAGKTATVTLAIKARGKAARSLKKKGKASVRAKITFTTPGLKPVTKAKTVRLVKQKKKKNRSGGTS